MSWNPFESAIERGVRKALSFAGEAAMERYRDAVKATDLQQQIAKLEVEKSKRVEEFEKREREVEHKVGLERKRQAFEVEQAKKETSVAVREENLNLDRERFKSEMDFQRKRLEGEVESLRTLVGQMLKRLPSAEIYADVEVKKK